MNQEPAHAGYWAEYLLCGVTSPWFLEPHVGSVYLPNLEVVFRRGVHLGMSAPIFWRSNLPQLLSLWRLFLHLGPRRDSSLTGAASLKVADTRHEQLCSSSSELLFRR